MEDKKACRYCLEDPNCEIDVIPGTDYCIVHLPESPRSSVAGPSVLKGKGRKATLCESDNPWNIQISAPVPIPFRPIGGVASSSSERPWRNPVYAMQQETDQERVRMFSQEVRDSKVISLSAMTFLEDFRREISIGENLQTEEFEKRKEASATKRTSYDLLGKFDMQLNLKSWTVERAKKSLENPNLDTTLRRKLEEALAKHVPLKWNLEDLKYSEFLKIREREEELRTLYATDRANPRIQELEVFYPIWKVFVPNGEIASPLLSENESRDSKVELLATRIHEITTLPYERNDDLRERLSDSENILFNEAVGVAWESSYAGYPIFIQNMPTKLSRNAIIAGGSAVNQVIGAQNSHQDFDIFLWGLENEKAASLWLLEFSVFLHQTPNNFIVSVVTTAYSTTFILSSFNHIYEVQVINRVYMSPVEVVTGFDLDSCCFWIQEGVVYTTPRGLHALVNRINVFDEGRMSTTYAERLVKYTERGFRILVPGLRGRGQWSADVLYRGNSGTAKILRLNNKRLRKYKQAKEPELIEETDYGVSLKSFIQKLNTVSGGPSDRDFENRLQEINLMSVKFAKTFMYERMFKFYRTSTVFYYHCGLTGINPIDAVISIISGNVLKNLGALREEDHFKYLYEKGVFRSLIRSTKETEYAGLIKSLMETYGVARSTSEICKETPYLTSYYSFDQVLSRPEIQDLIEEYRCISGIKDRISNTKILGILWALSPSVIAPISWIMENPGTQNKIGSFQPIYIDPFEDLERFRFIDVDE